jgi:hypothetical protein
MPAERRMTAEPVQTPSLVGPAMSVTYLLGPQRFLTTAGSVVRGLGLDGAVATITAGWQERENDDAELDAVMDGRSRNLHLYGRMMEVIERDRDVAAAVLALRDAVDDLGAVYEVRLNHALDAVYAIRRRAGRADIVEAAYRDALDGVRRLDAWYLQEVHVLYGEAAATGAVGRSSLFHENRAEVEGILADARVLAVAGGHVGMLLRSMQFFLVRPPAELPVVAWSAGAMAMTRTVVLFNDMAPTMQGAEVWDRGLGRVEKVVALPHARLRLRLDDRIRMQVLAARFAGSACLLLDDGAKVEIGPDGTLPPGARIVRADGTVGPVAA